MEKVILTPNKFLKVLELNEGENKFKCQIQIIKNFLQVSMFTGNILKHEGSISLYKIRNQICAFTNYNINDIFEEIILLHSDNFSLIKEANKYQLKIEFIVFRRKEYLLIDLDEYQKNIINKEDLINTITELKEIIRTKDEKIKSLEEELAKYKSIEDIKAISSTDNCSSYDNFNIKLTEPIHKLKYNTGWISCSTILKDGRFAIGSADKSIIIFNNKTFKPDLTIKEHNGTILCLTQLSTGILASCSDDKTIKLYNINCNEYKVMQTLTTHTNSVYKVIELKNKKLVSCSADSSIIFYFKDNNEYTKDFHIKTNGQCSPVIQTRDNEICYSEENDSAICFFDLLERKIITTIKNINKRIGYYDWYLMMTKDLLLITGENKLSIINVNSHSLVRTIDVPNSSWINMAYLLNKNMLVTADNNKILIQWKIEGDNLIFISKKEKAHDLAIGIVFTIGNGLIVSGDDEGIIKIWKEMN